MEARAWIVAIVFGLATGLILGRYREDRKPILGSIVTTMVVGMVVWAVNPEHIAGPSLTAGGLALVLGYFLSYRVTRTSPSPPA